GNRSVRRWAGESGGAHVWAGAAGSSGPASEGADRPAVQPWRLPERHCLRAARWEAERGEGRLRPARLESLDRSMGRPGAVIEVDRNTPPTLFHYGQALNLDNLPLPSPIL